MFVPGCWRVHRIAFPLPHPQSAWSVSLPHAELVNSAQLPELQIWTCTDEATDHTLPLCPRHRTVPTVTRSAFGTVFMEPYFSQVPIRAAVPGLMAYLFIFILFFGLLI